MAWSIASAQLSREFETKLKAGDPKAIESINSQRSLNELLFVLNGSLGGRFGEQSDLIRKAAIEVIRQVPGHAKQLGDDIERLSESRNTFTERERCFLLLSRIASPEAIAQIGRFLFDERNPEKDLGIIDGLYLVPNSHWATQAMGEALGEKYGIKKPLGTVGWKEVRAWQTWWQSSIADEYRKLLEPVVSATKEAEAAEPQSAQTIISSPAPREGLLTPATPTKTVLRKTKDLHTAWAGMIIVSIAAVVLLFFAIKKLK